MVNCEDGEPTDELNCTCPAEMFTCRCFDYVNRSCNKDDGCIPITAVNNGVHDCPDRSDDPHVIAKEFLECDKCQNITLWRLDTADACSILGSELCDETTCKEVLGLSCDDINCSEKNYACFSPCLSANSNESCNGFFQCQDRSFILASDFCNGLPNCRDGSDEIRSGFGILCQSIKNSTFSCVLPKWNLNDSMTPQCLNEEDVECEKGKNCFKCLEKPGTVLLTQVCDGTINCMDLSDECLCQNNLFEPICKSRFPSSGSAQCTINKDCDNDITSSHITQVICMPDEIETNLMENKNERCQTKFGMVSPKICNKVPECSDFSDECRRDCQNRPRFCNDPCRNFYRIGDRYCNGYNDIAFEYLDNSTQYRNCTQGFDENPTFCTERFYCTAGRQVSIPIELQNDGVRNCDDGSDEDFTLSSFTEMIGNPGIRYLIWVIATITLCGNSYVIISTSMLLRRKKMHAMLQINHILILNLAVADLTMGVYLLLISIKSAEYSGVYGKFDLEWRSSIFCTTLGSLAIISSETSVFLMTALSSFRLLNVLAPLKSLSFPTWPWYIILGLLWLLSCLLATSPAVYKFSNYFVDQIFFDVPFARNLHVNAEELVTIGCRYRALTNSSFNFTATDKDSWQIILPEIKNLFGKEAKQIGYYGETSLCMPRFYVDNNGPAAAYSLLITSINFVSFVYVCLSYAVMYKITSNRPVSNKQVDQQNARMQKRIARLLATDFICWMPICIIAFAKASLRFKLPSDFYAATIAFLLPVNSALNPLLYSPFFETLFDAIFCRGKKKNSASTMYSKVTKSERNESVITQTATL